jgi:hypothetical protein
MVMGKTYDELDERLRRWIADQRMFLVATAPSGPGGHVNLWPKGYADTVAGLDERTVAYLDLTGSGAETAPTCAITGGSPSCSAPFLARRGSCGCMGRDGSSCPGTTAGRLAARFPARRGARAVVVVEIRRIADSCGYAVALYDYAGERDLLDRWTARKDDAALAAYRAQRNHRSLDGLPALPMAAGDRQAAGSG